MRLAGGSLLVSASDLARHLGCRHLTALELAVQRGRLEPPLWRDPALAVLEQRGFAHEDAYLRHLRDSGLEVIDLRAAGPDAGGDPADAARRTAGAMLGGAGAIVQATLRSGRWHGRADVLLRIDSPSELGPFSYEVVDTKLSRITRAGTILQLCLYSDLVHRIQGRAPEHMHVVAPGRAFARESHRFDDHAAYYRLVRRRLEEFVDAGEPPATYPDPVPQCDICRWWPACDARRRQDDHLCLVSGIPRLHARELHDHGITTLAALASEPLPFEGKPGRGTLHAYERAKAQAAIQLRGRQLGEPCHELLAVEPDRGLARLPEPAPGDVFFDIEGDPFVGESGLEYLFGWATIGEDGASLYQSIWALDRASEKRAFERFIDWLVARWQRQPGLHVYHYHHYEPTALKRLMGRYATREQEVDRMLRAHLFVDLHAVVRQGLRASVERYSIKELEAHYGFARDIELRAASAAKRALEHCLELAHEIDQEHRELVERYNRDDCVSARALRDWLEELRRGLVAAGREVPRPAPASGEASEAIEERQEEVQELFDRLTANVPLEPAARSEEQQARWLLAHLLDYHRREDKVAWWEYYRLLELPEEELRDERAALADLELVERVAAPEGRIRTPVDRYRFPPQECAIQDESTLYDRSETKIGTVVATDGEACTIDVKKTLATADVHPRAVFAHDRVPADVLHESLRVLALTVLDHGVDGPGPLRAARDLLLARPPRLEPAVHGRLRADDEDVVAAARRLAPTLASGVLPIQGPPGAGKSYTGARMIVELVRRGKRVGVTAGSHKVIRNLLDKVGEAAREEGVDVRCLQKVKEPADRPPPHIDQTTRNDEVVAAVAGRTHDVVAGTPWLWARERMRFAVDTLFVDEAGQMVLANALAVAPGAANLVLIGDPRQLEQPQQGAHPAGVDVPALEHLLRGERTMPDDRGLFLDRTWRLHPEICAFTSELFYDGRLAPHADLERQDLSGHPRFPGAGLYFVPVESEGNQTSSPEEVAAVRAIVASLRGTVWVDRHGTELVLGLDEILVVAPYNLQVNALREALPDGARVGTVDKFQGQQAAVVLVSMTTSSPEEAPRGMEFLYNASRLNVATSRARCACILVASPRLFEPECQSPRQMRLANAFCRYLELAQPVTL